MMSEVEMPSVRWVGANIPVKSTKSSAGTRYTFLTRYMFHQRVEKLFLRNYFNLGLKMAQIIIAVYRFHSSSGSNDPMKLRTQKEFRLKV